MDGRIRGVKPCRGASGGYFAPMSTLTIELPEELRERLEAASARRTVPPAQVVLDLIKTLPDKPAENTIELSAYDLMKDDLGCVDSGLGDLSTNPKYLEGYGR